MDSTAFDEWHRGFTARAEPFTPNIPQRDTVHHRRLELDHTRAQAEQRTVEATLSSSEPVLRHGYREILDHSTGAIDLTRAAEALPLLWNHDPDQHIGSVRNVRIYQGRLRGTLHFGRGELAEEKWQAVQDGHLRSLSIGYRVHDFSNQPLTDGELPDVTITRWELLECSAVTIPADVSAVVGRDLTRALSAGLLTELPKDAPTPAEAAFFNRWSMVEAIREHKAFSKAFTELYRLVGERDFERAGELLFAIHTEATSRRPDYRDASGTLRCAEPKYRDIQTGERNRLHTVSEANTMKTDFSPFFVNSEVGERDISQFSLSRALAATFDPAAAQHAGFELEVMRTASKARGKAEGFAIPGELLFTRDLQKGNTGANLVGTDHLSGQFTETLKEMMVSGRMGVSMLSGLVGDVAIPKGLTDSTAGWIGGDGTDDAPQSDPTFGQITMSPHTVGAYSVFSRKMLLQALPAADALIRRSLAFSVAKAIDVAILNGTGTGNQPRGILNTSGIGALTYPAAGDPAFSHLVNMEGELMVDDAPMASLGYVMPAAMATLLKQTEVVTGQDRMIWETTEAGMGRVNGYSALASNLMPAGTVLFGNWAEVMLGLWSGLDINTDPYTEATKGNVRIIVFQDCDVAVRHAESFCALTEAA